MMVIIVDLTKEDVQNIVEREEKYSYSHGGGGGDGHGGRMKQMMAMVEKKQFLAFAFENELTWNPRVIYKCWNYNALKKTANKHGE